MLQHLPHTIGHWLKNVRPGFDKLVYNDFMFSQVPETIKVTSPSFGQGAAIPVDYTADGRKISPPLRWEGMPYGARSLVLIVEDADSPTREPLTHALITGLPA